jgi:predicted DCC family thiol-disulfide oxidoreductase YuxK
MASAVASTRLAGPSSIAHPGAPRRSLAAPPARRRDVRHEGSARARAAAVDAEAPGPSGRETPAAAAAAAAKYFAADQRPIILFDGVSSAASLFGHSKQKYLGNQSTNEALANFRPPPKIKFQVCNLCNGGVNFMLDWDPAGRARFAALQSPAGRRLLAAAGRAPDDLSSIVLCTADGAGAGGALVAHTKSDAVLRIGQLLDFPFPALAALGFLIPSSIRDFFFYDVVADNRYALLGRQDACRLGDARFEERFLRE